MIAVVAGARGRRRRRGRAAALAARRARGAGALRRGARRVARRRAAGAAARVPRSTGPRRRRTSRRSAPGITRPLRDVPRRTRGMDRRADRVAARHRREHRGRGRRASCRSSSGCRRRSPTGPASAIPAARPIDKFRGTAVGGVLAAGMLGLRDVLEPPQRRGDRDRAGVRGRSAVQRSDRAASSIPSIPRTRSCWCGPGCAIRPRHADRRATRRNRGYASSRSRAIVQRASTSASGHDAETRARSAPRAGRRRARTAR